MNDASPLFSAPPAPLASAGLVFVRREETTVVRSCATSVGHETVVITTVTIRARRLPYRCKRGEQRVRTSALTEAQRLAALLAYQQTAR